VHSFPRPPHSAEVSGGRSLLDWGHQAVPNPLSRNAFRYLGDITRPEHHGVVDDLERGHNPGLMRTQPEWWDGREYTYATTNPDVARAFAVKAFGLPRDRERSVYRVKLDDPIVEDPDIASDEHARFVMSHWGTVIEVFEADVTMSIDEANQVRARYAVWPVDGSPVYDDEGYGNVPPLYRGDARFDAADCEEIRHALRSHLGTYPTGQAISAFLKEHYPR
jgi:hypothetical protein